ncbi:hypothetical protein B0H16DRAFT_1516892 [Mycena metata]|uniref:F-box domain-containing protein n=1 Tax=Mycena metata TaxID=1033252 RepID=A0AAD7JQP9_9AGAR|nr:hypothetical protein B0H16DRAFT_1516892 [Mycena metata]
MTLTLCTNCGFALAEEGTDRHSRLSKLDAIIASLTAERQKLQAESDAMAYPILSLPTEITSEIFRRWCTRRSRSHPHPSKGPLLLAQICHRWRQIALHTPELWRDPHFTDGSSVDLFNLWLDRSGNLPLDLELYSRDSALTGPLVEASIARSHRWQDVKFTLSPTFYSTLDLRKVSFPVLRSISLKNLFSGEILGAGIVLNAPLLREAHICTPADLLPPQITSLTLESTIELTECIRVLRGCPNLVKLAVSTSGQAHVHTDPLTLPALESLECNLPTTPILEHLTLPLPRRLGVTGAVQPEHAVALKNFTRRSACPLHSLSITVEDVEIETFASCLTAVPESVSDLEVVDLIPGYLLAAMQRPEILPHPQILRTRFQGLGDTEYQDLIDAARIRLSPAPPRVALEGFTLHIDLHGSLISPRDLPTVTKMAQFRALAAAGLKIKFTIWGSQRTKTARVVLDSWTK